MVYIVEIVDEDNAIIEIMMRNTIVLPANINEVITHLDNIVIECEQNSSQMGFFPAMYNRVTRRVRDLILEGAFEDNARMERFDVIFANRYLEAYYAYAKGRHCSESWKVTFDAAKKWSPMVIQHLIASMNTHISLDLGIAAGDTQRENLPSLKKDFDKVNDILDSLIDEVEAELREIFHPLVTFDKVTRNSYWRVAHVGIIKARRDAWQVAEAYVQLHSELERRVFIHARDKKIAKIGSRILFPPLLVKMTVRKLRFYEKGSVINKIAILNR